MPLRVMVGLLQSQKLNNFYSFIAAVAALFGAWYMTNYSGVHRATYEKIHEEVGTVLDGIDALRLEVINVKENGRINRRLLEETQERLEGARLQIRELDSNQDEMMREDDLMKQQIKSLERTIEDIQQKLKILLENLPENKSPTTHGLWWSGSGKYRS